MAIFNQKSSGGYQVLVLILVHSPRKYSNEIFNQKYEISSGGGLFSMLQVWFINYKRTILDRFACPDKSVAKSTKLKLFLLPPKMYNGASNWNKFTPRPNSSKTFCIFQSRAVSKYHYRTRTKKLMSRYCKLC